MSSTAPKPLALFGRWPEGSAVAQDIKCKGKSPPHLPEGVSGRIDADVTRATNTQNWIQHRDFAALDDVQHRLAHEIEFRRAALCVQIRESYPKGDEGCNIEEATVALACALPDVGMAVQAKREVGALWRDVGKPPYTTLFNDKLTARDMWKAVLIMRSVSDELDRLAHTPIPALTFWRFTATDLSCIGSFGIPAVKGFRAGGANEEFLLSAARKVLAGDIHRYSQ